MTNVILFLYLSCIVKMGNFVFIFVLYSEIGFDVLEFIDGALIGHKIRRKTKVWR